VVEWCFINMGEVDPHDELKNSLQILSFTHGFMLVLDALAPTDFNRRFRVIGVM
jgi:hypothetical protein